MKTTIAAITLAFAIQASPLRAQSTTSTTATSITPGTSKASLTTEAAVSTGLSTAEKISATAVQLRAFGDVKGGVRFFAEGAWGTRSDDDSDTFGAAYPYTSRFQVIEAYGERLFRPGRIGRRSLQVENLQLHLGTRRQRTEKIALIRRGNDGDERGAQAHRRGGRTWPRAIRLACASRRAASRAWIFITCLTTRMPSMIAAIVGSMAVVSTKRLRIEMTAAKKPEA